MRMPNSALFSRDGQGNAVLAFLLLLMLPSDPPTSADPSADSTVLSRVDIEVPSLSFSRLSAG